MKGRPVATVTEQSGTIGLRFEDGTNSGTDMLASVFFGMSFAEARHIAPLPGTLFDAYLIAGASAPIELPTDHVSTDTALRIEGTSTAKAIRKAHEDSGLTWDQLAKVFCVSRRSVHSWANGARMNATNVELLMQFLGLLDCIEDASPDGRRSALLAIGADGQSALDRFRLSQSQLRGAFSDLPRPEALLGALHDDATE
jgi:hypothetical protein